MWEAFQIPAIGYPMAVFMGLFLGSFGNVVIHRLPKMLERTWAEQCAELQGHAPVEAPPRYNLVVPRSACVKCERPVRAYENIPIISWLILRGKCAGCGVTISSRYPIVEFIAGALALLCAMHFGLNIKGIAAFGFLYILLLLTFIDADTQLLPDQLTLPLVWAGLIVNYFGVFVPLSSALWGAIIGYLSLWSVYWAFKLVTGKEGMGYGDFKLLAAIGAWLGWQILPATILFASLVGAVVGIFFMATGKLARGTPMPFGPFLAAAGALALFFGTHATKLFAV
jgi:leader peptidase (prepilin peptidase) / N-methyltransferase